MTQYGEEDPDKDTNANLVKYVPDELKVVRLEKSYFHLQTITSHYIVIISLVYNKILI